MGNLFQLRMDIVCYERIATLIQMKEMNESRLRSCPSSDTHSYQQWQAMGACFRCIIPFRAWGVSQVHTHTRRNTAAWFIKGQMWLFSPLPLKARFLCGCQRKLSKDTQKNTLWQRAQTSGLGKIRNLRICFQFMNVHFKRIGNTP